jgi:hypothetical protein
VLRYIEENENESRGEPEARVQVERPQVKVICIKGLKIPPLEKAREQELIT